MSDQALNMANQVADKILSALNMLLPSHTTSAPNVQITYPPSHFFQFPPVAEPQTLRPPISDHTFARPFTIDPGLYNDALHVAVPVSIALVYATLVTIGNRVNKQREHKPWAFSKSGLFYTFVLTHNIFLALYSAWTCLGMLNTIRHSWPGLHGRYGVVSVVDALCKINGPRGLGSAATYNPESSSWGVTDRLVQLLNGSPDPTDVGRIWNEGLAYYGWLFYISKFYEIIDTFIILAKGKKSSILQTYHHAGAMMCMWAGIRYMSPPIWMFVFINSGLHTAMYTYYTLGTLSLPVPRILKQSLTTLQIAQFIFGASYAVAHLFVAYSIPVSSPYLFVHNLSSAMPSIASSVSSVVSTATASAGLGSWLKKAALRAAGEEGLAENVRNSRGETFGIDAIHAAQVEKAQEEIRYKTQYQTIHCLDTSGQVFAILLNALYLAPLTWLFINFFFQSYIRRVRSAPPPPDRKQIAKESSKDAVHSVEKEIEDAMAEQQEGNQVDLPPAAQEKLDRARANIKDKAQNANDAISSKAQATKAGAEQKAKDVKEAVGSTIENAKTAAEKGATDAEEAWIRNSTAAKEAWEKRTADAKEAYEKRTKDAKDSLEKRTKEAKEALEKMTKEAKEAWENRTKEAKESIEKRTKEAVEALEKRAMDGTQTLEKKIQDGKETARNMKENGEAEAGRTVNAFENQAKEGTDGIRESGKEEDPIVESGEDGDVQTDADAQTDGDDTTGTEEGDSEQYIKPEIADEDPLPEKGEHEGAVKADEEWDPEDGHDHEAEAYEVQIDEMLTASEKRAEQELLPPDLE